MSKHINVLLGDSSSKTITVSDQFGTKDKFAVVTETETGRQVFVDIVYHPNHTTFIFPLVPTKDLYTANIQMFGE